MQIMHILLGWKRIKEKWTNMDFRNIYPNEIEECIRLLNSAFDRNEIRSAKEIKKLYGENKINIICAFYERIVSCMIYWEADDMVFLENFATDVNFRGNNIGGQLIDELKKLGKPLVLEVEEPVDELTKRRVGFYSRHGFKFYDDEYYLPPLQQGNPVIKFNLMTYNVKPDEKLINRIYREIYQSKLTLNDYRKLANNHL